MKNILPVLMLVLILFSCAKEGVIDPSRYDFYPQNDEYRQFINSKNEQITLRRSSLQNTYKYTTIGDFTTDASYIYSHVQSNEFLSRYYEQVEIKNDFLESVFFRINEKHLNVDIEGNSYSLSFTPYVLGIIKKGFKLNDTWSNSQDITINHIGHYSSCPTIPDETKNIIFNYTVTGFNESLIAYEDNNSSNSDPVTFKNVATINVSYTFLGVKHNREYSFSEGFGLISFKINDNKFLIIKNKTN